MQTAANQDELSEFKKIALSREDEAGMIFVSCDEIPGIFIAVKEEASLRAAIDTCLTNAFKPSGLKAHVYTNGSISGPTIQAVVEIMK